MVEVGFAGLVVDVEGPGGQAAAGGGVVLGARLGRQGPVAVARDGVGRGSAAVRAGPGGLVGSELFELVFELGGGVFGVGQGLLGGLDFGGVRLGLGLEIGQQRLGLLDERGPLVGEIAGEGERVHHLVGALGRQQCGGGAQVAFGVEVDGVFVEVAGQLVEQRLGLGDLDGQFLGPVLGGGHRFFGVGDGLDGVGKVRFEGLLVGVGVRRGGGHQRHEGGDAHHGEDSVAHVCLFAFREGAVGYRSRSSTTGAWSEAPLPLRSSRST